MWKFLPVLLVVAACAANHTNDFLKLEQRYVEDATDLGAYRRATTGFAPGDDLLWYDSAAYIAIQRARLADFSPAGLAALRAAVDAYEEALIDRGVKGYARSAVDAH